MADGLIPLQDIVTKMGIIPQFVISVIGYWLPNDFNINNQKSYWLINNINCN